MPGVGLGPGSSGIQDQLAMYKEATKVTNELIYSSIYLSNVRVYVCMYVR
jgi:hypothetical protein